MTDVYLVEIVDEDYGCNIGVFSTVELASDAIKAHLDTIENSNLSLFDFIDIEKMSLDKSAEGEVVLRVGYERRAAKTQATCERFRTDVYISAFHKAWVVIASGKQWRWNRDD